MASPPGPTGTRRATRVSAAAPFASSFPKKQLLSTDVLYNSSYVNNAGELIVSTGEYQTDHLGQQAIAQIEAAKRASKPFCAPWSPLSLCFGDRQLEA